MKYYTMVDVFAFDICYKYLSQISAVSVCLEIGNSHDEDFQYCNLVLKKDFVIPDEWNERSTYVAVPIVEYCESTDIEEMKHAFFKHLKRNQMTSFTVYTEGSIPELEELYKSYQTLGSIEYYGMRCELSEGQYGFCLSLKDFDREQEAVDRGFCKTSAFCYCKPLYDFVWIEKTGQYYLCSDEHMGLSGSEVFEIHVCWSEKNLEDIKKESKHFLRV